MLCMEGSTMLIVTFEIHPLGDKDHPRARVIGQMEIALQDVDNFNVGTYESTLYVDGQGPKVLHPVCTIEHSRYNGAYSLVSELLKKHLGENHDKSSS